MSKLTDERPGFSAQIRSHYAEERRKGRVEVVLPGPARVALYKRGRIGVKPKSRNKNRCYRRP